MPSFPENPKSNIIIFSGIIIILILIIIIGIIFKPEITTLLSKKEPVIDVNSTLEKNSPKHDSGNFQPKQNSKIRVEFKFVSLVQPDKEVFPDESYVHLLSDEKRYPIVPIGKGIYELSKGEEYLVNFGFKSGTFGNRQAKGEKEWAATTIEGYRHFDVYVKIDEGKFTKITTNNENEIIKIGSINRYLKIKI
jgi:hypothetical protein